MYPILTSGSEEIFIIPPTTKGSMIEMSHETTEKDTPVFDPEAEDEFYIESPTLTPRGAESNSPRRTEASESSEDEGEILSDDDKEIVLEDGKQTGDIDDPSDKQGSNDPKENEYDSLVGTEIEEDLFEVYQIALDKERDISERKDAFRQLLGEIHNEAYNRRELTGTFFLTTEMLDSDILDDEKELTAVMKLLHHHDENIRTIVFDKLPFLIARCSSELFDSTISTVVQNLRKSLTICTWSSPSEANAIQACAIYLAGHYPCEFFNEIFPDSTGTRHDPLRWLSENYPLLKSTVFIQYPQAETELVRAMNKCASGVADGMEKCMKALECSMGILELWKGLIRVPGELGIALLGTWLGGFPREFLGYGRLNVPTAEATTTKDTQPSQPPTPTYIKRKPTQSGSSSWHQKRRPSTQIGSRTPPQSARFPQGFKRRRCDYFRREPSPGAFDDRMDIGQSLRGTEGHISLENRSNYHNHTDHQYYNYNNLIPQNTISQKPPSGPQFHPTPPTLKPTYSSPNIPQALHTPPPTATWPAQKYSQQRVLPHENGYQSTNSFKGGARLGGGLGSKNSRGREFWNRETRKNSSGRGPRDPDGRFASDGSGSRWNNFHHHHHHPYSYHQEHQDKYARSVE